MFFGWNRVSKGFHLFSTWMVAIGSNLSALWILVANGWMQYPVGMAFNPETARFEMENFWQVLFSPTAIGKFTHATSSGFLLGSLFVVSISAWFLLKKRHTDMAKKSMVVASVFGLLASAFVIFTGDEAAYTSARVQPMKLAAMEGLYKGETNAGLVMLGILDPTHLPGEDDDPFLFDVKIPGVLTLLANRELGTFVPGVDDIVYGNEALGIMSTRDKINQGRAAIKALGEFKNALNEAQARVALNEFNKYKEFLGYGYLTSPEQAVPPVGLTFYSFHIMVMLGFLFPVIFLGVLFFLFRKTLEKQTWFLRVAVLSLPLGYVAQETGWIVAEVGRQPWAIQGLLPVGVAISDLTTGTVQLTFFMFLTLFTVLLIAGIRIMTRQIALGPEE
jgi:cytochrome d ubiquinol oxidase subunit I